MEVIKKMNPGEPGTKRLLHQYGEQLLCVRYRGDNKTQRRITTVELVVDEGFYLPQTKTTKRLYPGANRNVYVQVNYHEVELRQKVKAAGGHWQPELRRWLIRYRDADKLGLKDRIEEINSVDI